MSFYCTNFAGKIPGRKSALSHLQTISITISMVPPCALLIGKRMFFSGRAGFLSKRRSYK